MLSASISKILPLYNFSSYLIYCNLIRYNSVGSMYSLVDGDFCFVFALWPIPFMDPISIVGGCAIDVCLVAAIPIHVWVFCLEKFVFPNKKSGVSGVQCFLDLILLSACRNSMCKILITKSGWFEISLFILF